MVTGAISVLKRYPMPKQYEAMRDKFAKTIPLKAAKTKAAKIYNSRNPNNPVTGKSEGKRKGKR